MKKILICTLLVCGFGATAQATPFTYAPPSCDFEVTFPEKPFIEEKCGKSEDKSCDEVVTYTQMTDASSLDFRITCNKDDPKKLSAIKPGDLKATAEEMAKNAGVKTFASDNALVDNKFKTAVALATGVRGGRDVIYTGQIWIGESSAMTLEGEMLGPENKKINDLYSQILKSVKPKGAPDVRPPSTPKK